MIVISDDFEGDEEDKLLSSLSALSIHTNAVDKQKEKLFLLLEDPDRINRLVSHVNEKHLETMSKGDLLGFWFIALKNTYPREIYRFYEMNTFIGHYNTLRPNVYQMGWLDKCLLSVYDDILVSMDPTIFYPSDFISHHFRGSKWDKSGGPNMGSLAYYSHFVFGTSLQQTLFTRIIDPINDKKILDDMKNLSLRKFYDEGHYLCINQYQDTSLYTMKNVKARFSLFYTILTLYKWLNIVHASTAHDRTLLIHKRKTDEIRNMFMAIKKRVDIGVTVDINTLFEIATNNYVTNIPAPIKQEVINRMNQEFRGEYDKDDTYYGVLFVDPLYDTQLRINREKYKWLVPFDEQAFLSGRLAHNNTTIDTKREIDNILIQESMLWINMLIYEISISPAKKPKTPRLKEKEKKKEKNKDKGKDKDKKKKKKKKKNDDSSDNEEGDNTMSEERKKTTKSTKKKRVDEDEKKDNKKQRVGHSILLRQLDNTSLLSVVHGTGVLSVYYGASKCESYRIGAGDNIQMPLDMIEYHILYDEV